jgi:DNA-binding NarL/FixJ family response regulator
MIQQSPRTTARPTVVDIAVHASDPLSALGTISLLDRDPRLRVLTDEDQARAEVIVIIEEADEDTYSWVRAIREQSKVEPAPRCVLVTDDFRAVNPLIAVECGVAAVLAREDLRQTRLVQAILAVHGGVAYLPPAMQGELLTELTRMRRDVLEPNGLTMSGLGARERDVLRLLAEGMGTDEIATELSYSERTVKYVLHGLMARYNLNTRAHAVAYAMRAGVV